MTTVPATVQERVALPSAARGPAASGAPPLSASDIFAMLRRRMVLVTVLFILFAGLAVGGFALWYIYFPGFQAECQIECISNIPETELTLEQQRLRQDEYERFVRTQALMIKSPTILSEALKITALRETEWYKSVEEGRHLLELDRKLVATPIRGTNILRVAMECRIKRDPAVVVNEVVNQWYTMVKRQTAEDFTSDRLALLQQELADLDRKITLDQDRLKSIAERLPPGAIENPGNNITAQQVRQYGETVALLELELSQLEQYRSIYNDPEGVAITAEDRAMIEQDPEVAQLVQALFMLQQQTAASSKAYGSNHSYIKQLSTQAEAADQELSKKRLEKLRERRADMREATNTAYDNTRYALFVARENLARAESALQDQDRLLFDYRTLDASINQELEYRVELEGSVKGLDRVRTQRSAINVHVTQAALEPLERHSPSLWLIPVGVFLAMTFSLAIALALELMDTSVRTTQDVGRHLDVAMLGAVPDTDDEEVPIAAVETAVRDAPRSMVAEAFRHIRTNLQFSSPADRQRTLVVTSPRPNDGKTTVACNLAVAVAQAGRRVLLVDANFRRPSVHRHFKGLNPKGLSNILIGDGSLGSYVLVSETPGLSVIGSGPPAPNPGELLGSELWRGFIQDAMSSYDQIIIDTAPVLLATDASVLATGVDGVILVVRANESSRGVARRACNLVTDVGGHLFGVVLNAARVRRGGYFREQLRTYYDYQADAGTGRPPALP